MDCKCPTPARSLVGDMEQQIIILITQIAEREGVTPEKLLVGLLPIVDRRQTADDLWCNETQRTKQGGGSHPQDAVVAG